MNLSIPSGPAGHIGISLVLAYLMRLNLLVTVSCGILPDLLDKPLGIMGVGGGRYVGHSLLFIFLVSVVFSLWKRKYGLAALVGGLSHLLLDIGGFVPWFYPFKEYSFIEEKFNLGGFFQEYFAFSALGMELLWVAIAVVLVFTPLWLLRLLKKTDEDKPIK